MYSHSLIALIIAACTGAQAATWNLKANHAGSTFFDGWTFVEAATDPTNAFGNIHYVSKDFAMNSTPKLAYINSAGNAIIKVDDVTEGSPTNFEFGRNSVRVNSTDFIEKGSLVIMDAVHLPFGCSVWPAFWMEGPHWPYDGEIDIIENVNLATSNQMALHSANGCRHPDTINAAAETGTLIFPDCFVNSTNGNTGCLVREKAANSYGQAFSKAGGGAYAMQWDDNGIKIWFFTRSAIPSDLLTSNPKPDGWPLPSAFYPNSACNMNTFFKPQTLILNINICGDFAQGPNNVVFNQTCGTQFPNGCLSVVRGAANYKDAYFEIKSVRVFTNGNTTSSGGTGGNVTISGASPTGTTRPGSAYRTVDFGAMTAVLGLAVAAGMVFSL